MSELTTESLRQALYHLRKPPLTDEPMVVLPYSVAIAAADALDRLSEERAVLMRNAGISEADLEAAVKYSRRGTQTSNGEQS